MAHFRTLPNWYIKASTKWHKEYHHINGVEVQHSFQILTATTLHHTLLLVQVVSGFLNSSPTLHSPQVFPPAIHRSKGQGNCKQEVLCACMADYVGGVLDVVSMRSCFHFQVPLKFHLSSAYTHLSFCLEIQPMYLFLFASHNFQCIIASHRHNIGPSVTHLGVNYHD